MRFRYGMDVEPVFHPRKPSAICVSQRVWGRGDGGESGGQQGCCAQVLDSKGRHAVTCPVGGKTIHRHDFISSRLANLLKPFAISVNTEVYVHELEQVCPETGQWTEAKLDIDVVIREGRYLLGPSNLANLTSLPSPAKQAAEPVEQPAVRGQEEEEVEKDEAGFLRP